MHLSKNKTKLSWIKYGDMLGEKRNSEIKMFASKTELRKIRKPSRQKTFFPYVRMENIMIESKTEPSITCTRPEHLELKKQAFTKVKEYRPISLGNLYQKILASPNNANK